MSRFRTRALLHEVLNGDRPADAALIDDLKGQHDEGQWLDFKSGAEFDDPKKAAKTLRRWTAGFANSDGGFLVFGVSDSKPRTIVSCPSQTGQASLHDWAARTLQQVAPMLVPPVRIEEIDHTDGKVLLIVVPRSVQFAFVHHEGATLHPLRCGDSTIDAPDYLVSDIVLGRRTAPSLEPRVQMMFPAGGLMSRAELLLRVENIGMARVRGVRVGLVSWTMGDRGSELTPALRGYIEPREPPALNRPGHVPWRLVHWSAPVGTEADFALPPFVPIGTHPNNLELTLPGVREKERWPPYWMRGALYILADGTAPVWYQSSLRLPMDPLANPGLALNLERLWDKRAIIAYEPDTEGGSGADGEDGSVVGAS